MTTNPNPSSLIHPSRIPNRWVQLIAGIVAMMAIANLQYAWTLFTKPMQVSPACLLAAVQGLFTSSSFSRLGWYHLKDIWSTASVRG